MPIVIDGTAGNDTFDYTTPPGRTPEVAETINGLGGDDTISGFRGNDVLNGGTGKDQLFGQEDDDTLNGGDDDDLLNGGDGNDTVHGDAGNDTILVSLGADQLYGDAGDDVFKFESTHYSFEFSKDLILDGGDGQDTIFAQDLSTFTVRNIEILDLSQTSNIKITVDQLNAFTSIRTSDNGTSYPGASLFLTDGGTVDLSTKTAAALSVSASQAGNTITTSSGNDRLNGDDGDDVLNGGAGNDEIFSWGDSSETYSGGKNVLNGGEGDDHIDVSQGQNEAHGGAGSDTFSIAQFGDFYDRLTNPYFNTLYGEAGDDTFTLSAGYGIADGGDGIDTVQGNGADFELRNIEIIKAGGRISGTELAKVISIDPGVGFTVIGREEANFSRFVNGVGRLAASAEGSTIIGTRLDDTIVGNDGSDVLTGGFGNDTLTGGRGTDILDGGDGNDVLDGGKSPDILKGGAGDDTYYIDSADQVFEAAGQGNDTIIVAGSYTLAAGQEIETIQPLLRPTTPFELYGNEFAQTLYGNDGVNILDGGGGADTLEGRGGDDTYVVDQAGDIVVEQADGGNDTVIATASYTLAAGQAIETLQLAKKTGTQAFNVTGNEIANTLRGNDGANVLDGKAGADAMYGRAGDDTYAVDNAGDHVFELAGQGNDMIVSTVSYALAADQEVETLQLARSTGSAALSLTGNAFDNTLRGNGGANLLDGKAGADSLYGRAGNDTYAIDSAGDRVFESTGEGNDTIVSTVSYALAAGQEVETMQFARATGTANLSFEGNAFDQTLFGNAGANKLNGGLGNDTLTGKGGADTFVFTTALGPGNVDHITDFAAEDTIRLAKGVFEALSAGTLSESAFKVIGPAVADADDRILYKQTTGELFYDADGSGSRAAVLFAVLDNKATLTAADFLVA